MNQITSVGSGSYGDMWVIGGCPTRNVMRGGRAFDTHGGRVLRRMVVNAGLSWEECWLDYAIPTPVAGLNEAHVRDQQVEEWRGYLADELNRAGAMGRLPRVVLAVGAAATLRLVGESRITEAWGGVYDLPGYEGVKVVPVLDPDTALNTKLQADKLLIQRAVGRAVGIARGDLGWHSLEVGVETSPTAAQVDDALTRSEELVLDTEFDPSKRECWLIGLWGDAEPDVVWSVDAMRMGNGMQQVLARHLSRTDLEKVAHWHYADVKALQWAGLDSYGPWFDTLVAFATLYPDLPVGLTHVARFYLNGVTNWKGMDHKDPMYNAQDVIITRWVAHEIRLEMASAGMWELWEEEIQPTLPLLYGLQERGLQVDKKALAVARRRGAVAREKLVVEIATLVKDVFDARTAGVEEEIAGHEKNITFAQEHAPGGCLVHPTYHGLRKKRWAKDESCRCKDVFDDPTAGSARDAIAASRKEITKCRGKVKRWAGGFDPSNNDHVRWLLYDPKGLGLPVQKHFMTGKPTVNATAVARLLTLKKIQEMPGVPAMLQGIKKLQHIDKLAGTFLSPPMDKDGIVYPPYRMHGTGTGRPAGGDDGMLGEKGVSQYKFNALNIPDEARHIYVPYLR